ncbi:secreted serine-rich protein [Streptomyces xiamenensis]|uniref:Secreted serine-rich protein n=1 Tax=Streptomyces xiamenensis TaxID=408015 RepID=A0A0F7CPB8_9ACTN|nr:secreted serine-rich protein [Streptomyces xiamenensis]
MVRTTLAAVALCALAAGCGGDSGTQSGTGGSGPSGSASGPGKPGRYSALPEPCGSVSESTLQRLLPDAAPEVYRGTPTETYDSGRRSGCTWQGTDPESGNTLRLTVDFERVISYDPQVSDDDQAELDFAARATEAGLPSPDAPEDPDAPGSPDAPQDGDDTGDDTGDGDAGGEADSDDTESGTDAGAATGTDSDGNPVPRDIGIGHDAYLDDRLSTTTTGAHRDVTVAFRSANVIATVHYTEITTRTGAPPESGPLQDGAQRVGRHLAGGFDD